MDGNQYAQVFAKKSYVAKVYPMNYKSKHRYALKLLCQEFSVSQKINFYGSK